MYTNRLNTLKRMYKKLEKGNKRYNELVSEKHKLELCISNAERLKEQCLRLNQFISDGEAKWRQSILEQIESEVEQALEFVYPNDGYKVKLDVRVLRGRIHVDSYVTSLSLKRIKGKMKRTQGMLFRQIVTLSAIVCIINLLGVNTVYVDETFSGASLDNLIRARKLLSWYNTRGVNMIIIAQNHIVSSDIKNSNIITVSRSSDNKTSINMI